MHLPGFQVEYVPDLSAEHELGLRVEEIINSFHSVTVITLVLALAADELSSCPVAYLLAFHELLECLLFTLRNASISHQRQKSARASSALGICSNVCER
eukprot:6113691-Pleurochrysis_carterae.AAC.1